jgi:hypothetical protein
LEATFTSLADAPRLTLEPDDPAGDPARRLGHVLNLWQVLGLAGRPDVTPLRRAQRGRTLRYGAWLGLRAVPGGLSGKIYVEMPLGLAPSGQGPGRLRMLGLSGDGTIERYFGDRDLLVSALPAILDPAGQRDRAADVAELLFALSGTRPAARLPVRDIGYSYRTDLSGDPQVTIYATSLALFGADDVAAQRLEEVARHLGGDWTIPAQIARRLQRLAPGRLHHGMVGLTLGRGHDPVLSCGLALPGGWRPWT